MQLTHSNPVRRGQKAVFAALAMAVVTVSAHAAPITFTNGGFETIASGPSGSQQLNSAGSGNWHSGDTLTAWTNAPGAYNFVFKPGDNSAPDESGGGDTVSFYGPPALSPNGGNYVALDADYESGTISQSISNLVIGDTYTVGFDFAVTQQTGYFGASTDYLEVTLGSTTKNSAQITDASHSTTAWQSGSLSFVATSTTETLSFLAQVASNTTPGNLPSFVLLDGVTVNDTTPPPPAVPEPGSLVLLGTGLTGIAGLVRNKLRR